MVEGSRFEDRLTDIARAEFCALLKARVWQLEVEIAEQLEIEEALMVEFQVENRKIMGGWA